MDYSPSRGENTTYLKPMASDPFFNVVKIPGFQQIQRCAKSPDSHTSSSTSVTCCRVARWWLNDMLHKAMLNKKTLRGIHTSWLSSEHFVRSYDLHIKKYDSTSKMSEKTCRPVGWMRHLHIPKMEQIMNMSSFRFPRSGKLSCHFITPP